MDFWGREREPCGSSLSYVVLAYVGKHGQEVVGVPRHAFGSSSRVDYFFSVGLKPMKTENLFQFQALGSELPHIPLDADGVRKLFYSISGRDDIVIDDATWVSEWRWDYYHGFMSAHVLTQMLLRANIRMCEKFGNGRVFLIGGERNYDISKRKRLTRVDRTDAAHCHSPLGAQGMNSGIQDAVSNFFNVFGPLA